MHGGCGHHGVNVLPAAEAGFEPGTANVVFLLRARVDKIVQETKWKRNNAHNFSVQFRVNFFLFYKFIFIEATRLIMEILEKSRGFYSERTNFKFFFYRELSYKKFKIKFEIP